MDGEDRNIGSVGLITLSSAESKSPTEDHALFERVVTLGGR
jgi:hypothetical protein